MATIVKGTTKVDTITVTACSATVNAKTLSVAESDVTVSALGGDDTIKVTGGNVRKINAGAGADTITVSKGKGHIIHGNSGNDTITIGKNASTGITVYGDAGNDIMKASNSYKVTFYGGDEDDTLTGGKGADKLYGEAGADKLYGGAGNDKLYGQAGNDKLYGSSGNDTLSGGKGTDRLTGGAGKDTFVYADGGGKDTVADYMAGDDTLYISSGSISKTALANSNKDVVFTVGKGQVTLAGGAGKTISLKDSRGSYTMSKTKITLDKAFTGTITASKYLSTIKTLDGRKATKKVNLTGNAKNNTIYGGKAGGTIKGGAGKDTFILTSFTNKTKLTINQSGRTFGDMDILKLKNVKDTDVKYALKDDTLIITHENGGTISVTNWSSKALSEIQFADNISLTNFKINEILKNYKYRTITNSGKYKATDGNDKYIVYVNNTRLRTFSQSYESDGNDNSTFLENSSEEIINGFPVTKQITFNDIGVGGIDSLDVSEFGGSSEFYFEGKDFILPMLENAGDPSTGDDDTITKITLKDFGAKDRIFELQYLPEGYEPNYLIVNSEDTIQGTNGDDIIYVTKDGQSVFSNSGWTEEVYIYGYNNTIVTFSEDNEYASVLIRGGNSNVINANDAKNLVVSLDNSSGNTVTGASVFGSMSSNNRIYGSTGNDYISFTGDSTNNTIYCKAGDDHISVNTNGNKYYGGAGNDLFDIGWFCSTVGTDIIYDYEFGIDTLQVPDKDAIADSVVSGSDILLNLSNGGSVKIIGAATNGISILDSSTGKTFNPLN